MPAALRAGLIYAVLTVALTYPLAFRLRIMDAGDSAFFTWAIGWERHALFNDPARLPHGNMFHPLRYTLGMDEPVLGTTVLVLPLALLTDDAVLLHNVARLLTYALSALTAYLLARELGAAEGPALLAGAAFAFSPVRVDQIAHLSTLGTQWLPLVVLFAFRFFRHGRKHDALLAGALFALAAYACGYHGVIGLIVLPAAVLPLLWGRWRRLPMAAGGAALAGVALLPLYWLHRAALDPLGYARGPAETAVFSAALESFLATSSWNHVWGEVTAPFRTTFSNNLFPGVMLPVLAVAGAALLWRGRRWPGREAWALLVMALAAVAVALGPEVRLMGRELFPGPFALARELPLFRMIRVPSRAGVFLVLPLAMLAAKALTALRPRPAVTLVCAALALAETLVVPIPMPLWAQVVDTKMPPPPVYRWLAEQPGEPVVVELPMLDIRGIVERPAYHESIYLVQSTRGHWKRLANGYAGIEPAPYVALRNAALRFPSAEALAQFRAHGVDLVILHRGGYGPNKWARIERDLPAFAAELAEVARFDGDTVFALQPPARP
ncbi:MAG TPA: hypothetical protein VMR21_12665 [Vicinamibacteria bacterium]|nr:hypothetical protein [Vicinamibacteria bacterium]